MDLSKRTSLPAGPQLRSYPAEFEVRAVEGSPSKVELRGYASVFDSPYEMYDMFGAYSEVVRSGAFTKTLSEGPDVAYLANHEGLTMARTASGSLTLEQDSTGLLTVARVNTTRSDVRDLVAAIEDGDVDQMSFAFRMRRQEWSPDYDQRDLLELDLNRGDVSAVNFGASPTTNVEVQRAFRKQGAAQLHRMAVEIREGKTLSASTMDVLSRVLELVASADDAVDEAQPLLADLMGVPNPDSDEPDGDDTARAAVSLDLLKRQLELEAR